MTTIGVSTIGIGWQVGVPSGWGTYGTNLAAEIASRGMTPEIFFTVPRPTLTEAQHKLLAPHFTRQPANLAAYRAGDVTVDGPMLHALGDQLDFPPELRRLHGRPELGVVFFESATIPKENLELAKRFAAIVTGSGWNAQVLRQHGYEAVLNCPQGVDLGVFAPGPRQGRYNGRFAIFSGGKLEYRKGQDLVVAAFKRFHARYPDALLVSAWHNPWPAAAKSLSASPHVKGAPGVDGAGRLDVGGWLAGNGLPADSWIDLGPLANLETVAQLREVDVAVLPSRCEGGTNLVAMECMATGVPTILSRNTGHLDLIADENCYPLNLQIPIGAVTNRPHMNGWGESSIEEIVHALENAYTDRADRIRRGAAGAAFMQSWGWPAQIGRLLDAIKSLG